MKHWKFGGHREVCKGMEDDMRGPRVFAARPEACSPERHSSHAFLERCSDLEMGLVGGSSEKKDWIDDDERGKLNNGHERVSKRSRP